ncbi:CoA pyrophosphatase [Corynebacterium sp. Q4381]|uniref:NUDIX hydrolase n=1 Tax=Corynebacterium sp. Marseille-Q4381 TaxID=3121597 RepID=UPI002FE6B6C0
MADVALQPERAPRWLAPLLTALAEPEHATRVRTMLASRVPQRNGADEAAVLILFTGDPSAEQLPDDAAVLITHRHPKMRSHSGQMAFPGGRIDPGDRGPVDAALREAYEETALERDRVVPLAVMAPVTTGGSRRRVRPVVAYSASPGTVHPASEIETDDVFFVPVRELVDPVNRIQAGWKLWSGPAFWARCYLIWGFTGALLSVVLDAGGWAGEWDREPQDLRKALARSCNDES